MRYTRSPGDQGAIPSEMVQLGGKLTYFRPAQNDLPMLPAFGGRPGAGTLKLNFSSTRDQQEIARPDHLHPGGSPFCRRGMVIGRVSRRRRSARRDEHSGLKAMPSSRGASAPRARHAGQAEDETTMVEMPAAVRNGRWRIR